VSAAPTKINGCEVIASEPSLRGGYVVLVDQGPGRQLRWVTGWLAKDDTVLGYRNFFHAERVARMDYSERCKRGC
jgi:hypothetical protein